MIDFKNIDKLDFTLVESENVIECKGKIYKANISKYIGKNDSINMKISMAPMKRLSCSGCPKCDYLFEYANEEKDTIDLSEIENDKLYQLYYNITKWADNEEYDIDGSIQFKKYKNNP